MDKLFANMLAHLNVAGDGSGGGARQEELRLLQDMFKGSEFSQSVLTTVLDEHKGHLDAAVDTLLNLANDPMRCPSPPPQQMPTSTPPGASPATTNDRPREDVMAPSISPATTDNEHGSVSQPPAVDRPGYDNLNQMLSDLAQEDVRLMEELRLLEEEKQRGSGTPVPGTPSLPVSIGVSPPESLTPEPRGNVESGPTNMGSPKEEVLSILHTQAMFPPELETMSSGELKPPFPLKAGAQGSVVSTRLEKPAHLKGDVVAVSWDLGPEGEPAPGDWIGLFKQNQPSNAQYLVYKKTGGEKSGMLDVVAPGVGTWEFRFLPKGSYDYVMKSNLLIIGPQLELIASLDDSGDTIQVSCKLISGQVTSRDWIGLYKVETYHNKEYLDMRYVNNVNESITIPAPKPPGHYELRYFPAASSYNDVSRSNLITIEDRDMVLATPSRVIVDSDDHLIATWQIYSAPVSKWDWFTVFRVGLYPTGSQTYVEYHYVDPNESTCVFAVPKQPGQYELRYYSSATSSFLSTQQRRSTKVTVVPATAPSRSAV